MKTLNKTTALILCFFLGSLGIHRLKMGYKNWWLMLLTFGCFGVWTLIDFIRIAKGSMVMANGEPLLDD